MKKLIWTTKEGEEIEFKNLELGHLQNIIELVKRRAKECDGDIINGGGHDDADIWCDVGYEEDWLIKFRYKELINELKSRQI